MLEQDSPHGVSFHIGSKFPHLSGMEQGAGRLRKQHNERTVWPNGQHFRHCTRRAEGGSALKIGGLGDRRTSEGGDSGRRSPLGYSDAEH